MFIWIRINLTAHPRIIAGTDQDEDEKHEMQIWTQLAKDGVLIVPGWFFSSHISDGNEPDFDSDRDPRQPQFRSGLCSLDCA